uniref:Putative aminopeptidase W07G4.4 n=1 Tax=Magallana gigas TaxID=29159 RepID=K1QUZ1_MAGGI
MDDVGSATVGMSIEHLGGPLLPELVPCLDINDPQFDGVVVVTDVVEKLVDETLNKVVAAVQEYAEIFAPTGPLNRDYDDVRRFYDAAEKGIKRIVTRDIGGSDPERMAAPNVVKYVEEVFKGTCIKVSVNSDQEQLNKDYPLYGAVNRAASQVSRHRGRVIFLEYTGEEKNTEKTLFLVGKGVTYDTGGADIKAGGVMAGMHRDKCGAAAVAGFFKILSEMKPKGLKVVGAMAMVRNSVGSNCYVADEIITSRAGVRVRVGNTDAEGRMAMADVLCHLKEQALSAVNPQLFTIATLTGHVIRAYGENYSAILDNGPARIMNNAQNIQEMGDQWADPFEISTLRRDDYDFHRGKSEYEDVLQCNNTPSSGTARGHQTPAAFLIEASGLEKHGKDSDKPLPYSHLDIAGSSGPFPGVPTGAPIVALAAQFVFPRC